MENFDDDDEFVKCHVLWVPETDKTPFFILWNPKTHLPPKRYYKTREEAERIADIMARKNEPTRFYVMECVSFVEVEKPTRIVSIRSKR